MNDKDIVEHIKETITEEQLIEHYCDSLTNIAVINSIAEHMEVYVDWDIEAGKIPSTCLIKNKDGEVVGRANTITNFVAITNKEESDIDRLKNVKELDFICHTDEDFKQHMVQSNEKIDGFIVKLSSDRVVFFNTPEHKEESIKLATDIAKEFIKNRKKA